MSTHSFHHLVAGCLAAAVSLAAAAPAAACSMGFVDLFEQVGRAETVATGTVVPGGIAVDRAIKGEPGESVSIPVWHDREGTKRSSCVPQFDRGSDVLVFVDGQGSFVAAYQSAVPLGSGRKRGSSRSEVVEAVERYANASGPGTEVLVEVATGADGTFARDAAWKLMNDVRALESLDDDQIAELRGAIERADERVGPLALVMARLGDRESAGMLVEQIGARRDTPRVALALEILLNHDLEAVRSSRQVADDQVESVRADFRTYLEDHPEAGFEQGYRERDRPVPSGREELAERVRAGPTRLDRVVAIERCEREVGRSLARLSRYYTGLTAEHWNELADACESGRSTVEEGPEPSSGDGAESQSGGSE